MVVTHGSRLIPAGLPCAPGSPEDGKQLPAQKEMSRGALAAKGWGQQPDCFWLPPPARSQQRGQFLADGWLGWEVGSKDSGCPGYCSA